MSDLHRSLGTATPATLNAEARTVEVTALSGLAPALRSAPAPDGTATAWVEELAAAGADLSRFIGGPALKDHQKTVDSTMGVVDGARAEGSRIIATVRFSEKPAAEEVFRDVVAGIVRGTSLGYRVQEWRLVGTRNGVPVFRAVRWQPYELSFTPTPVDAGATVRSEDILSTETTGAPPTAAQTITTPIVTTAVDIPSIRAIATAAKLPDAWVLDRVTEGATVEQARSLAFDAVTSRGAVTIRTDARVQVGMDHTDPAEMRRAMADALAARLAPGLVKVEGRATEFMGYRALAMAGALATARGERVNVFDQNDLLERAIGAHSTSDFPELLANTANKILLAQYQLSPPTYRRWAARKSFNDFKQVSFLRRGDLPRHQEIAEAGGVEFGTMSENKNTVQAKEYVAGIAIGRRALLNDDLGALSDFSTGFASNAAADENTLAYSVLKNNAALSSDNIALFHASHGNLAGSGAAISDTTLSAARTAMARQTSLDGRTLNLKGAIIVVPPELYLTAKKVLTSVTPTKTEDVNPWSGQFEVVEDAELTGTAWYIFAEPAMCPTIVYGYVGGAEGPQILTERCFETQGIKVRSSFDFGVGSIDFRGAYKNAGA